jgi:formylglycine-generating enzyme required for sulfatase activity
MRRISTKLLHRAAVASAALATLLACSKDDARATGPSPDELPASVAITGATVVQGFRLGHLRDSVALDGFRITKSPVTVAQYRACVSKGACAAPSMRTPGCIGSDLRSALDRATYALDEADALPVTCATVDQAAAYCAWIGGALPTSEQWMLAARGPSVARFAWGDDEPTCERHPGAAATCVGAATSMHDALATFAVGKHPRGASPSGVEDVLVAPGEMLAASSDSYFGSCAPPAAACAVYGVRPGAIDSVEPIHDRAAKDGAVGTTTTFRCVMPEGK